MRANRTEYLFSVSAHTPPTMTVDSGEEFTVEVRGAFDDVEDITAVPTPFMPPCDGHPLAPIAGPIVVRGAKPGDTKIAQRALTTVQSVGADFPVAVAVRQYRCPSLKARFLNRQNTISTAIYGLPALFR
jgi:acetamidase/formamidase